MLYIKELDNINELYRKDCNLHQIIKYIIYFIKKVFCILTINENTCIIPYRKVKNKFIITTIAKIIEKNTKKVVLSKNLYNNEQIYNKLLEKKVFINNGNLIKYCLTYNFVEYICKIRNEELHNKEIFILSNSLDTLKQKSIIHLAKNVKRVNIVTKNINYFKRLEKYLEENLGIAITITNNKRKSLLKANVIINYDFDEEMLNSFNINPNAIIIQFNNSVTVKSKLFNGVNILDYQIIYDDKKYGFSNQIFKNFDNRLLYESTLFNKNYEDIILKIKEDNIKIVNLIGINGVINTKEFYYLSKNNK